MTLGKLKTQNNSSFSKINFKREDKVILGIGVMFMIALLFFIGIANKLFNYFEEQNKGWQESLRQVQHTTPAQTVQPIEVLQSEKSPMQASFDRTAKAFKENKKKREAAFKAMEKNFKERFKKVVAEHGQRMKRLHKQFDESMAKSSEAFDKKVELYSVGLPKYAGGIPKEKKNAPHQ